MRWLAGGARGLGGGEAPRLPARKISRYLDGDELRGWRAGAGRPVVHARAALLPAQTAGASRNIQAAVIGTCAQPAWTSWTLTSASPAREGFSTDATRAFASVGGRVAFAQGVKGCTREWRRCLSSAAGPTDRSMSTAGAPTGKASSKRKKRPRRPPIPRDSTVVVSRWQGIKTKLQHLRDFLTLYWQSAKLFAAEVRLAFRLGYNIYLKGHRYTRAERRAMQKAAVDIIKILPLASMTMVVGTEITALLAARAIPNMLPRAFKPVADKVDENLPKFVDKVLPSGKDRRKAHADNKVEVADNLHALSLEHVSKLQRKVMQQSKDAAAFAASRASGALAAAAEMSNSGGERASLGGAAAVSFRGQRPVKYDENLSEYAAGDAKLIADFLAHMDNHETRLTARDIAAVGPAFRRHMQLQQLSRLQLVRMNQYMNQGSELMNLVLPTFVLVRRLRRAIATARTDDKDIHFEGVSSLSLDELRDACIERGVSVNLYCVASFPAYLV